VERGPFILKKSLLQPANANKDLIQWYEVVNANVTGGGGPSGRGRKKKNENNGTSNQLLNLYHQISIGQGSNTSEPAKRSTVDTKNVGHIDKKKVKLGEKL